MFDLSPRTVGSPGTARPLQPERATDDRGHQLTAPGVVAYCAGCGRAMDRVRSTRRYCSSACRQRAYRQRRAPIHTPVSAAGLPSSHWPRLVVAYARACQQVVAQRALLTEQYARLVEAQELLTVVRGQMASEPTAER
jgi:hypothetical protein